MRSENFPLSKQSTESSRYTHGYVALKKHVFIAAMRNRWFNERSAVSDKEGKQAVSLLDGMEIVVGINPHSPTKLLLLVRK